MGNALVQSATIQLKAQAGGGFGSVPDGGLSGGTPALAWSATGLSDGETMTISTDGSEGWDFSTNQLNYASLGFGQGFLELSAVDTALVDTIDPITGNAFIYENSVSNGRTPSRFVKELDGIRALYTSKATGELSGGFIDFDGGVFADDTPLLFSSWVKTRADSLDAGLGSQWKSYRVNQERYFDTPPSGDVNANSAYHKIFVTESELDKEIDGEMTHYSDANAFTEYNLYHPTLDNKWTRHDFEIMSGSVDSSDGEVVTRSIKPNDADGIKSITRAVQLLYSGSINRYRWLKVQDYIKDIVNAELWRTDLFFQIGTKSRFELADGATPELSTDSKILLPKTWANGSVTLHLYKQMLPSYSGMYVHFYDATGVFRKGVQI